jgi:drug/metabolite transporter (DMT)-like permease
MTTLSEDAGEARPFLGNAYLLLAFASLCWSGNHIVGRMIAGHVPPLAVSTLRWIFPTILIFLLARPYLQRDWPVIRSHWPILTLLALTGGAGFGALIYIGLQYTGALNVSLLNSLAPVFIVAAGALVFRDPFTGSQAAGIAVSLLGVLVIVTRADLQTLLTLSFNVGDIIVIVNMVIWAVYSIFLRKKPEMHWLSFMFAFAAISTIATLPLAVIEYMSGSRMQADWLTLGSIAFIGIFPSFLAFAAWIRGVGLIGSNRAGPFLHLIPLYSAVLAVALLGESLMLYLALGFVLILTGVWLAARAKDAPAPS